MKTLKMGIMSIVLLISLQATSQTKKSVKKVETDEQRLDRKNEEYVRKINEPLKNGQVQDYNKTYPTEYLPGTFYFMDYTELLEDAKKDYKTKTIWDGDKEIIGYLTQVEIEKLTLSQAKHKIKLFLNIIENLYLDNSQYAWHNDIYKRNTMEISNRLTYLQDLKEGKKLTKEEQKLVDDFDEDLNAILFQMDRQGY